MPSSNGVYSLPAGYLATTGATIQASQHNPPLEDIAAALTARLSRDGTAPMTGPIKLLPGTVAAPGAVFSTDPASGWFKTTNGIGVSIAGVQVAEFVAGGINGARLLGELIPYSGQAAAPPLTVYPAGQTLSRTTYAALWTFAQAEIALGNTFYNNGNGTTTFGIGDLRGRVIACKDSIFTAANRLTSAGSGVNGAVFGAVGGAESQTIVTANLPPYTPAGTIVGNASIRQDLYNGSSFGTTAGGFILLTGPSGTANFGTHFVDQPVTGTFTGTAAPGQISTPQFNVQPTMVCVYLLFAGA